MLEVWRPAWPEPATPGNSDTSASAAATRLRRPGGRRACSPAASGEPLSPRTPPSKWSGTAPQLRRRVEPDLDDHDIRASSCGGGGGVLIACGGAVRDGWRACARAHCGNRRRGGSRGRVEWRSICRMDLCTPLTPYHDDLFSSSDDL